MHKKHICTLLMCLISFILFAQDDTSRSVLSDTIKIPELIIRAKIPVITKGDSVSYLVDYFNSDPQATTEDVLKRLPGVEVSQNGIITVDGKPINKIFVNGKEYLIADLKTLTQNLPAEILDRIQIADWYSEEEQFTGIRLDNNEKVINLKFKKEYSNGLYGKLGLGYGTNERYQGHLFSNYMGTKGSQITGIVNSNNTSGIDVGSDSRNSINKNRSGAPGLKTVQKVNLNFSFEPFKRIKIRGKYNYSEYRNVQEKEILRTTFLQGDSMLLLEKVNKQVTKNYQHSISLDNKVEINTCTNLNTSLTIGYSKENGDNNTEDIIFYNNKNQVDFSRLFKVNNNNNNGSISLVNSFMKRFAKNGRTVIVNYNCNYNNISTDGITRNTNTYYSPPITSENSNTFKETGNHINHSIALNYNEPIGRHSTLSLKYAYDYSQSNNYRNVFVETKDIYLIDTGQSQNNKYKNENSKLGVEYNYYKKKVALGLGWSIAYVSILSENTVMNSTASQKGINYFPSFFTRYSISKKSQLNIRYFGKVQTPSIDQLQTIPNYTDSFNIYIGNPKLKQALSNNLSIRYNNNNVRKGWRYYAAFRLGWINNQIINKTELNSSKSVTTPINANGNYNISVSAVITMPIICKYLKASLRLLGNNSNRVTIINNNLQHLKSTLLSPTILLTYNSKSWYSGRIDYTYRLNVTQSSSLNNLLKTHNISHNGSISLPKNYRITYHIGYDINIGYSRSFQSNFLLMNLAFDKTFIKPQGLALRVSAFDIFNNYPTVNRVISDNYIEDVTTNRIGYYFILTAIYKFNFFR